MEIHWLALLMWTALLVRTGQALAAMGFARAKNVASAGLRSLADLCVVTICFWAVGAAIFFQQKNPVLAVDPSLLIGWCGLTASDGMHWLAAMLMVLIASGIAGPVLAERSKLLVPLTTGGLVALLVPVVGRWVWGGWLGRLGFIDNAGASVIHLTGAMCAAAAAAFVGPRDGKYNRDGSANMIPGHSVPMILAGTMFLLVGWLPYMMAAGLLHSTDAPSRLVAPNVIVAAASGGLASLVISHLRFGKVDVLLTCSGMLGGLVSITAAAWTVEMPVAFVIGLIAGTFVPWAIVLIDLRWKIDDPTGAIAVHGAGATWALLAAAVFSPGSIADRLRQLGVQALGVVVVAITVIVLTSVLMLILRSFTALRARQADEYDGLDLAEHDVNAHPDFQQTMIKSYHLREA